jgi:protein involved in polysaccharide export with SLBB domain
VANGLPARRLAPELLGQPREELQPIPLRHLGQPPPDPYLLAPGDVLGVWAEGALGEIGRPPPVNILERGNVEPSIGFPIPIREDGTVSLPFIEKPVKVEKLTITEAEEAIRKAYTGVKEIVRKEKPVIVTLFRPRQYHILVIREDAGGITIDPTGLLGNTKRGAGFVVELPAYENDVLNALAKGGGPPGLDAANEIIVYRGRRGDAGRPDFAADLQDMGLQSLAGAGGQTIRIPLRLRPGEPLPFRPEDVILRTGDILYIQARDTEVFYTAGLLPAGEFVLPRDYDLDVVEAVARVRGPLINGGFGFNNLTGSILNQGIGFPSPSLLTVLRRTPGGGAVPIRIDLNRAFRDPRERILVQPGDVLVLQETPGEAIARYFTAVFRLNSVFQVLDRGDAQSAATVSVP